MGQIRDTPFPLVRYFLIYGGVGAVIFYIALISSILFSERDVLTTQYVNNLQEKAAGFYGELSRSVLEQHTIGFDTVLQQSQATKEKFRAHVSLLIKSSFRFSKVKVFNTEGLILFNHKNPSSEGGLYDAIQSVGFQNALHGKIFSKLESVQGVSFMEVYLPTYGVDGKKVVGVMEIYEDVSRFEQMAYQALRDSIAMPSIIFLFFAIMLSVLIRKAGSIINSSTYLLIRIRQQMEKYISQSAIAAIYSSVTEKTELFKGEIEIIVPFFSDIRGFTSYSESRAPQEVVDKINHLFDLQADSITRYHGIIDKFVGDEIMAIFPPDQVESAVLSAIEIISTIHNNPSIELEVGIGIHYGEAVVGSIGTENRRDYTAIGNSVNSAARMCGAAAGGELIISQVVHRHLPLELSQRFKQQEPLNFKGKQEELITYSLSIKN
ncbi:MAG: adenylate/guanylate cyclase domain-containing protein [Bdellovibrionales bacterium]|jgi:class 3 adenylate cyclase|nr:adenylate/guanylate cyclase domain-containing protein [Bdellovibrionales bacterium]MBT3526138.1 adenylate/guanylate cyclase domain-containing protein [Bdellovibrionales bacterium]MBT7668326.1 adenylate/guanylate cyclase domain-containing protein [Bdellovibrionales bacterium]MBT7768203.1 adenylate/guanylate cyclase domain-containing protein [Bdellovibrionales bacterium]